jgi:hypothetical protein
VRALSQDKREGVSAPVKLQKTDFAGSMGAS